jgi:antitoxin (DNA-binding transcriptional repressor) of toxin-antitoxin stability system
MARKTVTIHVAKTNLSRLVALASKGEEIVIARGKLPVAKLVPLGGASGGRRFGAMKGKESTTAAFFEALPDDELDSWER